MKRNSRNSYFWPTLTLSALALGLLAPTALHAGFVNLPEQICSSTTNTILTLNNLTVLVSDGDVLTATAGAVVQGQSPTFAPIAGLGLGQTTTIQPPATVGYTVPNGMTSVRFFAHFVSLTISCIAAATGAGAGADLVTW
jgi:hypothetical protein